MRILIVDDEADNRALLDTLLRAEGYETACAEHGAEALAKLDAQPSDLVVTDLMMPVMDGFQLCRQIKRQPLLSAIPVVIVTGVFDDPEDEKLAKDIGASRFLSRPLEIESFLVMVREVLAEGAQPAPEPTLDFESETAFFRPYSERLSRHLEVKVKELETLSQELEARVHQRTAELEAANEGLKAEIAERARLESELALARDAAVESARLKAAFLANMSHEIRTPMNGVIGMTSLLLDTSLNQTQRHYAETIRQSGQALLAIVNDILDFSKIEAHKLSFETCDFNLREVLESALDLVADQAFAKGLELAGLVLPEVPTLLRGDPGRLRQVILNLVGNAIKFTEQGEVIVRVSRLSETDASVELRFEIKDTGIGIAPGARKNLFQAFSQADGSSTRKYGGSGLGLAISKQLVEMMRGQIHVESIPELGSTFWFTVFLDKQRGDTLFLPPVADLSSVRVLIVDDNPTNREIMEHAILSCGMRFVSAASGPEALHELRSAGNDPFQLAILDLQMPGMDGFMLAREIKADPQIDATRLIMLTSLDPGMAEAEWRALGFAACHYKPIKQSLLFACLIAALGDVAIAGRTAGPAAPAVSAQPLRILLAEDNVINQQVAVGQLRKLGYPCDIAANGHEVLDAVARAPYDAILMDCQMPQMDGYAATRALRQRERQTSAPRVRIIAMTAHAMQGDRETCLAAGMDDYITKPVMLHDLQQALNRCTPGAAVIPAPAPEAPAPADDGAAPVDLRRFNDIAGGEPQQKQELLELFLGQTTEILTELNAASEKSSAKDISRLAHKLAGASANCGIRALVPPLRQLEQHALAGELASVPALLQDCHRHVQDVRQFFAAQGLLN